MAFRSNAIASSFAQIGEGVATGAFTMIEDDAVVGDRTAIESAAHMRKETKEAFRNLLLTEETFAHVLAEAEKQSFLLETTLLYDFLRKLSKNSACVRYRRSAGKVSESKAIRGKTGLFDGVLPIWG